MDRQMVRKLLLCCGLLAAIVLVDPVSGAAHGATSNPASRIYTCRFENTSNEMCANVWSQGSQALYDWMEVNIGDVGGQHQQRIPNGELCSAGRDKYAALNIPSANWPINELVPSGGKFRLEYTATAPHATAYFRFYLTKQGFDPSTSPLGWNDLELVFDSGPAAAQSSYAWDVDLPARTGHHILYTIWQRSDSPEAFYSCSDVRISAGGGGYGTTTTTPQTSTTAAPPTTTPTTVGVSSTAPGSTTVKASTSSTSSGASTSSTTDDDSTDSSTTTSTDDSTTTSATSLDEANQTDDEDAEIAAVTMLPASSLPEGSDATAGSEGSEQAAVVPSFSSEPKGYTGLVAYATLAMAGLLAVSGLVLMRLNRLPLSTRAR